MENAPPPPTLETGNWTHGLFGCFDNLGVCLIAYFVPCITFGQTRQRLTGDGCVLYGLLYLVPFLNCILQVQQRGDIRTKRAIPGGTGGDFCTIFCCTCCALIQEEQEAIHIQEEQMAIDRGTVIVGNIPTTVVIGGANPTMYPPGPPQQQQLPPAYNQGAVPQYNIPASGYPDPAQQYNTPAPGYKPPVDYNMPAEESKLPPQDMDRM